MQCSTEPVSKGRFAKCEKAEKLELLKYCVLSDVKCTRKVMFVMCNAAFRDISESKGWLAGTLLAWNEG